MIETQAAAHGAMVIYRTRGEGRRRARNRLYGLLVVGFTAAASVVVANQPRAALEPDASSASAEMLPPGPFSYFPH